MDKQYCLTQNQLDLLSKYGINNISGTFLSDKNYYTFSHEEWIQLTKSLDKALGQLEKKTEELLIKAKVCFECYDELLENVNQHTSVSK